MSDQKQQTIKDIEELTKGVDILNFSLPSLQNMRISYDHILIACKKAKPPRPKKNVEEVLKSIMSTDVLTVSVAWKVVHLFITKYRGIEPDPLAYRVNNPVYHSLKESIREINQTIVDYTKLNKKTRDDNIKRMHVIMRGTKYIKGKTSTARKAFLYLYNINDTHLGYGITVDMQSRDKTHQKTFENYNYNGTLIHVFEGNGEEIEQTEYKMKQALELTRLPLEGFRTEATHLSALNEVLNKFTNRLNMV